MKNNVYEDKVAEANLSRDALRLIKQIFIPSRCGPLFWQSLCILGWTEDQKTIVEETDGGSKKLLYERLASDLLDTAKQARSGVNSLQHYQCKQDPTGAYLTLFLDFVAVHDRSNASQVIQNKEIYSFIWKPTVKLEPPDLCEQIRDTSEMLDQ